MRPNLTEDEISFAEKCLCYFIQLFGEIVGDDRIVYNVHNLTHLANECRLQGSLDEFSAFPFETRLGQIKSLIRGTRVPLVQLKNRVSEMLNYKNRRVYEKRNHILPLAGTRADSFYIYRNVPVRVLTFDDSGTFVIFRMLRKDNIFLYDLPFSSTKFDIFVCYGFKPRSMRVERLAFLINSFKCVGFHTARKRYVLVPIIHHESKS